MTADLDLLRQLYRGQTMTETGERLAAQLAELSVRPSADGCDQLTRSLAEASTAVSQMRTRLLHGEQPTV